MSTALELVPDLVEEPFDEERARQTLVLVEQAMSQWIGSTVRLADLVYKTKRDQCWRVDEDYRSGLASGAIAPPSDEGHGSHALTWLAWKFNRAARTVRTLADYGELRSIIGGDPELPQLAEPEFVARPLSKLLRPKYLNAEKAELADQHPEAVRSIWRQALARAEGAPAKAVPEALKIAKTSDFAPIRRAFKKSMRERRERRQVEIAKAVKAMGKAGHDLIRLGAVDRFDEVTTELARARKDWRPS